MKIIFTSLVLILNFISVISYSAVYDKSGAKLLDSQASSSSAAWKMISFLDAAPWRGIQKIGTEQADCSAVLIDTGRSETEKAYVLTNGHCSHIEIEYIGTKDVFINEETFFAFTANFYFDSERKAVSFKGNKLVYLTMSGTDIAIYELDHTIADLKSRGFNFFKISKKIPKGNEKVINVGMPMNHMPMNSMYIHYSECKLLGHASIKENVWSWPESLRHNCSAVGGMSGSPLIDIKTNEIIGLVNTVVEDEMMSEPDCSMGKPCEIKLDKIEKIEKISTHPEFNYAQRVDKLALCFKENGDFDLNLESCKLAKPIQK